MVEAMETPPRRRRSGKGVNSPMLNQSMVLLTENDDVKEKKARRKSQLLSNNLLSPGGVQASPGRQTNADRERRRSVTLSHAGMSNEQLKAHYASCIKLSSENKINVKNAFALHLIDHMKELLKESQNVDSGTNFQLASCTLDAGVKIYSYRVDCVHKDTYKVLGSLGMVDNQEDDDGGEGSQGSQEGSQKVKKPKKSSGKTIEKNLKNINCEEFDVDFELDPYFHKTSAAYDEGGTAGLLSLQLKTDADGNQLVLDSSSKIAFEATPMTFEGEMSDLHFLASSKHDLELVEMCPPLSTFLFRGWDKNSNQLGFLDDSFDENVHRFDVNAPVMQDVADDFDTDSLGGGGYDDYSDGENPNEQDIGPVEFDGQEAQFATPRSVHASILNCTGASTLPL